MKITAGAVENRYDQDCPGLDAITIAFVPKAN